MSNILGKVYVEREEKGIQVDDVSFADVTTQAEAESFSKSKIE
jgi:hypothetical protein